MRYITLPLDFDIIENINNDDIKIDMSDLKFEVSKEYQTRAAFIFIRNINIDLNLDFTNCNYEQKEDFILFYLQGNINVNIPSIKNTWIDILLSKYTNLYELSGILSLDEIDLFYSKNKEFIDEVNKLIASLAVLGVYKYCKSNAAGSKMIKFDNEFEETDYDKINFNNFSLLTDAECFNILLQASNIFKPRFYKKYFDGSDEISIARINTNLPIIGLLNILFAPQEIQNTFINNLDKITTPQEEDKTNE